MARMQSVYKLPLPDSCIDLNSKTGRRLFSEALATEYMEAYFPLSSQLCTQAEPAFCALSTLVMVLNTLDVDPGRVWRRPWRWFTEYTLDCCVPQKVLDKPGVTMPEMMFLSACNGLDVESVIANTDLSLEKFRHEVKTCTASTKQILILTYSRAALNQHGNGHFTTVSGYHEEKDMILILDNARFKYRPYWVSLTTMFEAMKHLDLVSGLPRGYIVAKKVETPMHTVVFKLPSIFCAVVLEDEVQSLTYFMQHWNKWLRSKTTDQSTSVEVWREATDNLINATTMFQKDILAIQKCTACDENTIKDKSYVCRAKRIYESLSSNELHRIVQSYLDKEKCRQLEERKLFDQTPDIILQATALGTKVESPSTNKNCHIAQISPNFNEDEYTFGGFQKYSCNQCSYTCDIHYSHLLTMFLLALPYRPTYENGTNEDAMACLKDIFMNNVAVELRQELQCLGGQLTRTLKCKTDQLQIIF